MSEQTAVFEQPDPHGYDQHAKLPERELGRLPGPVAQRTSPSLRDAISHELKDLAKMDINPSNLMTISRFAEVANELLMVRDPIAEVRKRGRGLKGAIGSYYPSSTASSFDCDPPMTGEVAPNETFGSKIIRELIPALHGIGQKPEKSVEEQMSDAIITARERGLDDVAEKIESKLREHLEEKFLKDAGAKDIIVDADVVDSQKEDRENHQ